MKTQVEHGTMSKQNELFARIIDAMDELNCDVTGFTDARNPDGYKTGDWRITIVVRKPATER